MNFLKFLSIQNSKFGYLLINIYTTKIVFVTYQLIIYTNNNKMIFANAIYCLSCLEFKQAKQY